MSDIKQDPLTRVARSVGDFANPFYQEERQRDVWNEASAFGLQLGIWTALLASTVVIWTVGRTAVLYVDIGLVLTGAVCLLTVAYAHRLGVSLLQPQRLLRPRMLPYALLMLALLTGLARAHGAGSVSFGVGIAAGVLVAALTAWLTSRQARSST